MRFLLKSIPWFTDGGCNEQGIEVRICKYQSKIQWHILRGKDAIAFQVEVAAILDCVTSCLRKRLVKEQFTICTDSQAAVAALAVSGTKSLLVADCVEKLRALLEVNYAIIMCEPEHRGV